MELLAAAGRAALAAASLVLPTRCAGCAQPGSAWCHDCRRAARRGPPSQGSTGDPPTWSATVLDGPVRLAVTAHKDGGRSDVRPVLAPLLATAIARALAEDPVLRHRRGGGAVLVVPVPTAAAARRRRGEDPLHRLAAAALATLGPGLVLAPVLRHARGVVDQSRLDRAARRRNLHGALAVPDRGVRVVAGATCVVVDDVVTTGATLAEAARALRAAGAGHVVAATVAATP